MAKKGKNVSELEEEKDPYKLEYIPAQVSTFDRMLDTEGLERGSTVLISGGCGSGKTMFVTQSAYHAALNGEKVVFFSLNEEPEKIKAHMYNSFGWDLDKLEKNGNFVIKRVEPYDIALSIETLVKERGIEQVIGKLKNITVDIKEVTMPFHPDRVIFDSLSDLAVAFSDNNKYRAYIKILFDSLRSYNSVNLVTTEVEQEPNTYSRNGIEEFVVDGVVVLYNIKRDSVRTRALEILKMRFTNHLRKMVPFKIGDEGIVIYLEEQVF